MNAVGDFGIGYGHAHFGYDAAFGQPEIGLFPADHFQINIGQQFSIKQRTMLGAFGIVDAVTFAQGIKAVWPHGVRAPCHGQSVCYLCRWYGQAVGITQFSVDKAHIETGVVDDQF